MGLREHHDGTLRIAEIPNLQLGHPLIIIRHSNLGGYFGVPRQRHLPVRDGRTVLERKDRFVDLQIPHHRQTILRGRCQDVLHLAIPTHTRDAVLTVQVGTPGTEYLGLRYVLLDVHDEHILTTHRQQVRLEGVEFHCRDGTLKEVVDHRNAPMVIDLRGSVLGCLTLFLQLRHIPKYTRTILHATRHHTHRVLVLHTKVVP